MFVKELELALIERRADIAVHSMKDVPAVLPNELEIASIAPRHNPRDAFISTHRQLSEMPDGANMVLRACVGQGRLVCNIPGRLFRY